MEGSVEHTLEESLKTVETAYDKAKLMHAHVSECIAKMEGWLAEATEAAQIAQDALSEFATEQDAEDWLPLFEGDTYDEIHTMIARMEEMLP